VLVVGPNGAGKTNLLESLHVGTQGFSPRTRNDAQLVRFGAGSARVALDGRRGDVPLEVDVVLRGREGKRLRLNGAPLRSPDALRAEVATLVFTPDRLAVVKGAPIVRRAYFDRALGRLFPARADVPSAYAAALAQRNAALRRVAAGLSSRDALEPWTERISLLGAALVAARHDLVAALGAGFDQAAGELGLAAARLRYDGQAPLAEDLAARLDRDVERGTTGLGPHLDDVGVLADARDLRLYGSQGEQRLAVLALILAEATAVEERRGVAPLLLLDDVLSELDGDRRRALASRVSRRGQTVVTATAAGALPADPDVLVEVTPGHAERR
jgi:DNA replication and repair protein RecF